MRTADSMTLLQLTFTCLVVTLIVTMYIFDVCSLTFLNKVQILTNCKKESLIALCPQ